MTTNSTYSRLSGNNKAKLSSFQRLARYFRLIFFNGPKVLLTSRISGKCAFVMTIMCMPALLFCFMLTVPGMIFQSPYQHAYFYFSKVLNEDPTRWIALILAGVCALLSLAVPATMTQPDYPVRY